jgi:membrane protease YdiL (CAAX protease family)
MKRLFDLASIAIVIAVSMLDSVVPPVGIPLALVCIWGVLRLRSTGWAAVGMARPTSWRRTLGLGVVGAVGIYGVMALLVGPVTSSLIEAPADLSRFDALKGNVGMLLVYLTMTWTTAAFGEEIIWRGFVLTSLARVFGDTTKAWALALAAVTVMFGLLHAYQGPTGVVHTGAVGLMLAGLYLATGRNLWASIVAHGLLDTQGFLTLFLGLGD